MTVYTQNVLLLKHWSRQLGVNEMQHVLRKIVILIKICKMMREPQAQHEKESNLSKRHLLIAGSFLPRRHEIRKQIDWLDPVTTRCHVHANKMSAAQLLVKRTFCQLLNGSLSNRTFDKELTKKQRQDISEPSW
jgi:hypothetical protein